MHDAPHLRRWKEDAFSYAVDSQEAVAGAIRADSSLDQRSGLETASVRAARRVSFTRRPVS
jgi:hypothetical protein